MGKSEFGSFWEYTRTCHKHFINDGFYYTNDAHGYLWEIVDCRRFGGYHLWADGYDLYHKGEKIKHGKTVKELKQYFKIQEQKEMKKINKK